MPRVLNDDMAETEIKKYILQKKSEGVIKINVLDIMKTLRLPAEQINRIMPKLQKFGVREID